MHESFGARLRRYREENDIALTTIAEQTKIKLSLLEDLERDDISHWPAGIFRRAFIRSYANALNLDPDTLVREFCDAHPAPADVASAAAIAAAIEREGANGKAASPFRSLMASLGFSRTPAHEEPPLPQPIYASQPLRVNGSTAAHLDAGRRLTPSPAEMRLELPEPLIDDAFPMNDAPSIDREVETYGAISMEAAVDIVEPMAAMMEPVHEPLPAPISEPVVHEPDFMAFAHLCTEFSRIERVEEVPGLLREAARMMDASGLIVWVWDAAGKELRPALTHGYSKRVVAQLPGVCREDDNATAAAFRSGQPCIIDGNEQSSAAFVLPLMAPGGSAGVLAIELQQGRRLTKPIRAVATIFAALIAQLVGGAGAVDEETMDQDVSIDHPLAALNG